MGKVFGKGFLDKAIKMQPNATKKAVLANTLKGAAGEGAEEAVSGFLDPYLQRATYNENAENASAGELAYQAAIGAALGGMLGGTSNALEYRGSKKASERAEAEKLQAKKASNTFNTDSNTLGDRYVTTTENGQKAIVRNNPTDEDMKRITPEYEKAVDSGLLQFVRDVKNKVNKKRYFVMSKPTSKAAEDIKELTGIDVSDFNHKLKDERVSHILNRHGENGQADKSMSDLNDLGRIQYVLDNYDDVTLGNEKSTEFMDKNNNAAPTIVYSKRVNGSYYIVEAVPENSHKALQIVSAYKTKQPHMYRMTSDDVPLQTPETPHVSAASTSTIPQQGKGVNTDSAHIDERDYKSVSSRKVKAFSYEHPEVRPFYVTEAQRMKRELQEAEKPSVYFGQNDFRAVDTDTVLGGHGRIASDDIAFARDELKMSYAQIEKALDDIIEDGGRENSVGAKKMEILFDDVLSMGTESEAGYRPPSAEYVEIKQGIDGTKDYGYSEARKRYESGEHDPIHSDPYALQRQVWAMAERKGHELTADEETELQILQEAIDSEREAYSSEQVASLVDDIVSRWDSDKVADSQDSAVYAKAYEQMVNNSANAENQGKARELSEDEERVKRFIKTAALNARLDVKYKDMPTAQKAYYKDGTIYINANRSLNEGMKSTVAHEIFHSLEGSKEHDKIVELALKSMGEGAVQRKIDSYGKYGIKLDEEGAKAEIGAEYIEKALTDEATINQILLENKSLAGRIWERIKELVAFYKAKKSMTAEEAREYKALLKAKRLYEDGLAKLNSGEYEPYSGERNARYKLLGTNAEGVEVYETPEDIKKLPYAERKEKFLDLMRNEYRGRTAKFKVGDNVYYARFEDADLKKNVYGDRLSSTNGWKAKINAGASGDIFDLVENAKYDGSKADVGKTTKAHKEVTDWDYFVKQVQIDNKVYDLLANVRKKNNSEYVYSIQLKDNKKIRVSPPVAIVNNSVKMGDQHSTINIPDTAEKINTQNAKIDKNNLSNDENARFSIDEQTDTPQFKAWFGDSKVVDDEGKPKVVYSGHGNSNLFGSKFDIKKATSGGFYFTEDADIASSYAKDKLGTMERYNDGEEYRFKNAKGEYKDTIGKVRLNEEQVKVFDEWFDEDMGYTFEDYVRENAPYDESIRGLNYNGGKYNLQNIYKLMESLGYTDNGWNYRTQQKGNSTFEDLLDEMGIDWDSYLKPSGGVFPVYLSIKNPIDTSKEFPQDLMNELEYAASKERKSDGEHWTKDYPLKKWVEDIKNDDGLSGWATQVPTKARKIMLEMGYDGIKDTGGKQGGAEHVVWVALEPTQVKSAFGNRGTFDPNKADIRYSVEDTTDTTNRYNELIEQYGEMDKGMEPRVDRAVPKQTNDWDKVRKFTRTAMESENVHDEAKSRIEEELVSDINSGKFVYEPVSNQKLQDEANQRIRQNGYEGSKGAVFAKYRNNERIRAEDVAELEQLIVKASAEGRVDDVMDMVGLAAMVGTEMGQSIQAMSMLKRMTPEGKLKQMYLLRDRLNSKYELSGNEEVEVNKRLAGMLLNKDNTAEDTEVIQEYIISDLAKQLPVGKKDKIDAWRYLAMLGNPRTHMRNTIGNVLNLTVTRLNDQLARVIEAKALKEGKRTKSARVVSKDLKEFAQSDWEKNGKYLTDLNSKYGERGKCIISVVYRQSKKFVSIFLTKKQIFKSYAIIVKRI